MKKLFLSLAIIMAGAMGALAATGDDNKTTSAKTQTTCNKDENCKSKCPSNAKCNTPCNSEKGKCEKSGKPATCDKQRNCSANKGTCNAFEGLNLTEQQKTKLAALRQECKAEKDKTKKSDKKELSREEKQKLAAEKKAKRQECRKKYLEGVKSILTPEQYTKFLENSFLAKGDKKNSKKGSKHIKHHGKHGNGEKGNVARKGMKTSQRKDMKKKLDGTNA